MEFRGRGQIEISGGGQTGAAEALRGCPNIEQLDLAWNGIGPAGAR